MNLVGCIITALIITVFNDQCNAFSESGVKVGETSERLKRHVVDIRVKRTSYRAPPPVPFDYSNNNEGFFTLVLRLITPYCDIVRFKNCRPIMWVIESFKFQLYNKLDPCYNKSIELDPEKVSSIQDSIDEIWLGLGGVQEANMYWKRQGSCSLRIPELNDEFKFFKKSIDLFHKFNVSKILERKNMHLGGDYSIDDISAAISEEMGGKQPQLGCLGGLDPLNPLRDGVDQFNEVIIFLDKQFNPINNPGWKKWIFENCPKNVTVHYGVENN